MILLWNLKFTMSGWYQKKYRLDLKDSWKFPEMPDLRSFERPGYDLIWLGLTRCFLDVPEFQINHILEYLHTNILVVNLLGLKVGLSKLPDTWPTVTFGLGGWAMGPSRSGFPWEMEELCCLAKIKLATNYQNGGSFSQKRHWRASICFWSLELRSDWNFGHFGPRNCNGERNQIPWVPTEWLQPAKKTWIHSDSSSQPVLYGFPYTCGHFTWDVPVFDQWVRSFLHGPVEILEINHQDSKRTFKKNDDSQIANWYGLVQLYSTTLRQGFHFWLMILISMKSVKKSNETTLPSTNTSLSHEISTAKKSGKRDVRRWSSKSCRLWRTGGLFQRKGMQASNPKMDSCNSIPANS